MKMYLVSVLVKTISNAIYVVKSFKIYLVIQIFCFIITEMLFKSCLFKKSGSFHLRVNIGSSDLSFNNISTAV